MLFHHKNSRRTKRLLYIINYFFYIHLYHKMVFFIQIDHFLVSRLSLWDVIDFNRKIRHRNTTLKCISTSTLLFNSRLQSLSLNFYEFFAFFYLTTDFNLCVKISIEFFAFFYLTADFSPCVYI